LIFITKFLAASLAFFGTNVVYAVVKAIKYGEFISVAEQAVNKK